MSICGIMAPVPEPMARRGGHIVSQRTYILSPARRCLWAQVLRNGARRRCPSTSTANDSRRHAGSGDRSSSGHVSRPVRSRSAAGYNSIGVTWRHPSRADGLLSPHTERRFLHAEVQEVSEPGPASEPRPSAARVAAPAAANATYVGPSFTRSRDAPAAGEHALAIASSPSVRPYTHLHVVSDQRPRLCRGRSSWRIATGSTAARAIPSGSPLRVPPEPM